MSPSSEYEGPETGFEKSRKDWEINAQNLKIYPN